MPARLATAETHFKKALETTPTIVADRAVEDIPRARKLLESINDRA